MCSEVKINAAQSLALNKALLEGDISSLVQELSDYLINNNLKISGKEITKLAELNLIISEKS